MPQTFWDPAARTRLLTRARALSASTSGRWGRMSSPQMLAHITDAVRMAAGDLPFAPLKTPLRFTPLKQLVIYVLPWPKGAPTAAELIARSPAADRWNEEVAAFDDAVQRLVASGRATAGRAHPAFGPLTYRAWGVLIFRHIDHHLRQFGV